MKDRKTYIAISSFINGMGSLLDVSPLQLNRVIKKISLESDVEAVSEDRKNIGKDLSDSLRNYGDSIKGKSIRSFR